jgi:hypothetical protein
VLLFHWFFAEARW